MGFLVQGKCWQGLQLGVCSSSETADCGQFQQKQLLEVLPYLHTLGMDGSTKHSEGADRLELVLLSFSLGPGDPFALPALRMGTSCNLESRAPPGTGQRSLKPSPCLGLEVSFCAESVWLSSRQDQKGRPQCRGH